MPEGPEVRIVGERLNQFLTGKYLLSISVLTPSYEKGIVGTELKLPAKIEKVCVNGKKIFIEIKSEINQITWYLYSTLGMEGKWSLDYLKHTHVILNLCSKIKQFPIHSVDVALRTGTGSFPERSGVRLQSKIRFILNRINLYYSDTRRFGKIKILTPEMADSKMKELGPDILDWSLSLSFSDFNLPVDSNLINYWFSLKNVKRYQSKEICWFLMNQKIISGIGNYLKAEILYFCKIRPDRRISELTDLEYETLLRASLLIIQQSYLKSGKTIRTYTVPDFDSPTSSSSTPSTPSTTTPNPSTPSTSTPTTSTPTPSPSTPTPSPSTTSTPESQRLGTFTLKVYGQEYDPLGYKVHKQEFSDKRTTHWVPQIQL